MNELQAETLVAKPIEEVQNIFASDVIPVTQKTELKPAAQQSMIQVTWEKYKQQLTDNSFKFLIENVLVLSTLVATGLTIVKFCFPEYYSQAVEFTTAWLAIKKGH